MKRVLIIEDNLAIRENLEELLMLSDYEVLTAANGTLGIDLALTSSPDLILCDIAMPEKMDMRFWRRLPTTFPLTKSLLFF